jgi:hypothetical protein
MEDVAKRIGGFLKGKVNQVIAAYFTLRESSPDAKQMAMRHNVTIYDKDTLEQVLNRFLAKQTDVRSFLL